MDERNQLLKSNLWLEYMWTDVNLAWNEVRRNLIYTESLVNTRVSTGRDVPRDVPGQNGTGRPVVPLSRDKGRSKCPGTNSSVPSRPGTK